ncbi:MAG: hypothetical protein Q7J17_09300 [Candidatus Deferrimicrobium sp.]|nr:hypothetical protein [Candidatus Deferrimicrobium sp.]
MKMVSTREFENLQFDFLIHIGDHHIHSLQNPILEHVLTAPLALQDGQFLQDHDRLPTYLEGEIRDDWAHLPTAYMAFHDFLRGYNRGRQESATNEAF